MPVVGSRLGLDLKVVGACGGRFFISSFVTPVLLNFVEYHVWYIRLLISSFFCFSLV